MCLESTKESRNKQTVPQRCGIYVTHQVGNEGRTEQVEPEIEMHYIAEDSLMGIVEVAAGQ